MRALLLAVLLAAPAVASDMSQSDSVSQSSAAATYVNKAGDTMTGDLVSGSSITTSGGVFGTSVDAQLSGLGHGMTDILPTNSYMSARPESYSYGGLNLYGVGTNSAASGPLRIHGVFGESDPADTVPAILFDAAKKNGTTWQAMGSAETAFQFTNLSTKLMTGLGDGSIGIGTASPATTLDVNGSAQFGSGATKSTFSATGGLTVPYGVSAGSATFSSGVGLGSNITAGLGAGKLELDAVSPQIILQISNVTQGYVGPSSVINLGGSATSLGIRGESKVETSIAGTIKTTLDSTGLGIGTASPATTLDVNGSAQFGSGAAKSTFTAAGLFIPRAATLATIQAWTPTAAELGGFVTCSNCADPYSVCQSTGATIQGFRLGFAGTTECK